MSNTFLQSQIRTDIQNNSFKTVGGTGEELNYDSDPDRFFYDGESAPLKSTQQLNLDWSKFENHTFFMSAEVKVNVAFDSIINKYPFDGTKKEIETFLDGLTGFEKWVFDSFPRYRGALHFNGLSYISVVDATGNLYPELSKNKRGESIINPSENTSLSIEFQLYLPKQANNKSVILQKRNSPDQALSIHLINDASDSEVECQFIIVSGSQNILKASTVIEKGITNHICAVLDKSDDDISVAKIYVNNQLKNQTVNNIKIKKLGIDASTLDIGTGSYIYQNSSGGTFTPSTLLSGSIDELRIFHSVRDLKKQDLFGNKSIFASPDLKLYYKFNEPLGLVTPESNSVNSIVLDSSGNSLHAKITNFTSSIRITSDSIGSMTLEKDFFNPVLFPGYEEVQNLNSNLLYTASLYDHANPNLITRLIPPHYLLEGAENDGFGLNVDGNGTNPYYGNDIPGTGKIGSQQMLLSFLYVWAKYFDEIKIFTDQFSNINTVDYETNETTPDNFLDDLVKRNGFKLPRLFTDSTVEQYLEGDNIDREVSVSQNPLSYVQSMLTRRALVSMPNILKSKGTQYSVKAFLRTLGIDPESTVRIREYGGLMRGSLGLQRENKSMIGNMLKFNENSILRSPYLSGSRIEPGYPTPAGTFVDGISDNKSDGLFTSGSWTYEGLYKFNKLTWDNSPNNQSLVRLQSTGSIDGDWLLLNMVAKPPAGIYDDCKLNLFVQPVRINDYVPLELQLNLTGSGIFDGNQWYVSFGRIRNDEINSIVSSSYFIRACKLNYQSSSDFYETSSFYNDNGDFSQWNNIDSNTNTSGSYLAIGSNQQFINSTQRFLNNTTFTSEGIREKTFDGQVSNVRFWSKALTKTESLEHVNNPNSTGVELPALNYNFVNTISGSFQKLRLDSIKKQSTLIASGSEGYLECFDFSQNDKHMLGSGFLTGSSNFKNEIFYYNQISPYFDEASTNDKVRIRGLQDTNNAEQYKSYTLAGPTYQITRRYDVKDDNRFSIDFSLVDSLNQDMINMFATLDEFNNGLGSPNLLFSVDYPDMEKLTDVYFNRLSSKIDFQKFFEFYRWFDSSISTFIEQLIPKRTLFKGANFIVEPHMLERGKLQYHYFENYTLGKAQSRPGDLPQSISWLTETPTRKY